MTKQKDNRESRLKLCAPVLERILWIAACVVVWTVWLLSKVPENPPKIVKNTPQEPSLEPPGATVPPGPVAVPLPDVPDLAESGSDGNILNDGIWVPFKALAGMTPVLSNQAGVIDEKMLSALGFSPSEIETCLKLTSQALAGISSYEKSNIKSISGKSVQIAPNPTFWKIATEKFSAMAVAEFGVDRGKMLSTAVSRGGIFFGLGVQKPYELSPRIENGKYTITFGMPSGENMFHKEIELTEAQFRARFGNNLDSLLQK